MIAPLRPLWYADSPVGVAPEPVQSSGIPGNGLVNGL
jgi:hypothetical protein